MEIKVKSKYIVFPVNSLSDPARLSFIKDGKEVYWLNVKLDNTSPDFEAFIDVSRFMGETLTLSISPEKEINYRETDKIDIEKVYSEPMRPQVHFTAKNGWINDPNGLIYLDGVYYMFYQYNPTEAASDNKHWGLAESPDLIHWEEKDTALFPDERGMIYSGSAFLDEKGVAGFGKAVLLYYTTTTPYVQNLSYSTDNFKTITHYKGNPIIPYMAGRNRDPKVLFCEEIGAYIMIFYLAKGVYCIFSSDDLKNWKELQRFSVEGERECPDIFPIKAKNGERKWVFMGGADKYIIGNFSHGVFTPEEETTPLHFGTSSYAGQTFSGVPDGRIIRLCWNRWKTKPYSFNGQMGIPMDITLDDFQGRFYLEANPVKEFYSLIKKTETEEISLNKNAFKKALPFEPYHVKLSGDLPENGAMDISVFGSKIHLNFDENTIKLGDKNGPLSITKKDLNLEIIVDRCSVEIFSDNGKIYFASVADYTVADRNLPEIVFESNENIKFTAEISELNSIWR